MVMIHRAIGKCIVCVRSQQQACDWLVSTAWPITGLLLAAYTRNTFADRNVATNIPCCHFYNTQSPSDIIKWLTDNVWINRSPLQTNMSLCIGSIHWLQFTTQLVPGAAAAVYKDWNGPNLSCRGQVVCPALWRHICNSFMKLSRESMSRSLQVISSAADDPSVFTITEKAPTRAFSWLKAPYSAFTFKTLLRHYAKRELTPRSQLS